MAHNPPDDPDDPERPGSLQWLLARTRTLPPSAWGTPPAPVTSPATDESVASPRKGDTIPGGSGDPLPTASRPSGVQGGSGGDDEGGDGIGELWGRLGEADLRRTERLVSSLDLRPGDIIGGRYRLEILLGKGGFGEVWRADDELKRDRVAIKLCKLEDDYRATLFRDEVNALRLIDLPGFVRMRDTGTSGDRGFVVMDLVDGKPFPGHSVVPLAEIAARLLEIIARLHGLGVVHGDLTPRNVLVDAAGYPTVLDLGLSQGRALRRSDGRCLGFTLRFVSPEQIQGHVDTLTDLYSIGALIDEAMKERGPPYDGRLVNLVIALTRQDPARRPPSAVVALALLGDDERLDALPMLAPAESPAAIERLFAGPEPFLHHRSRAAHILWARTGGRVPAMRRELRAWLRAGITWREGERLVMSSEGLTRLGSESIDAVDHPLPVLPPDADDLLCWIRLAHPLAGIERLRSVVSLTPEAFAAALQALTEAGAVWMMPDGTLATWPLPDVAPGWSLPRLRAAHAALEATLPPDHPLAVGHALGADYKAPGLIPRVAAAARRLFHAGRLREAQGMLERTLKLSRDLPAAHVEEHLLPECVLIALVSDDIDTLRHASYLTGLAPTRTRRIVQLEDLLAAAQAATPERAREALDAVGPLHDIDLEIQRHAIEVSNARRRGLEAEEHAIEACKAWAESDPVRRLPYHRFWLGRLRYRQGRYLEAASLHADAARELTDRSTAMNAMIGEAAARLEAFETRPALQTARAVVAEARATRHARLELSACFIARSARFRLGTAGRPRASTVEAAALVSSRDEAMIADIEAAIAWRWGDHHLARSLAMKASRRFDEEGHVEEAALYGALALHCGEPFEETQLAMLLESARACRTPDFGLQIMGLSAIAWPAGALAEAAILLARRGRPVHQWHLRLDVLSYNEALELAGVQLDTLREA